MKWKNSVFALILAVLLTGCGNQPPEEAAPPDQLAVTEQTAPAATEPEPNITLQYLPESVEAPEEVTVLKWVCLTERPYGGGARIWNETAAVEFNQLLADRNMPFRVQFLLFTMDQWLLNSDWFSKPEVQEALTDADLIYGMVTDENMPRYLLPITEYAAGTKAPSLENAVPHAYNWRIGTVGNEVYGIPTVLQQASAGGWTAEPSFFSTYGPTEAAFAKDFCEMDELFARIYSGNGEQPFLYLAKDSVLRIGNEALGETVTVLPGALHPHISQGYKAAGACFGVDYSAGTPTVVNALETDHARQVQKAVAGYLEAGYVTDDPAAAQLRYGTVFGDRPYTDHAGKTVIPNTVTFFHATQPGGVMTGVSGGTQHKEAALSLLNLIAEDESLRLRLFYGKEGRDYTVTDGCYTIRIYEDGSSYSMDFLSPLSYFSGMTAAPETANLLSPGTENWTLFSYDKKSFLETYQDILDRSILTDPVAFDYTGFEQELAAMEAVYEKYFPAFSRLTEQQYGEMLRQLEAAGSKRILEAFKRQTEQGGAQE